MHKNVKKNVPLVNLDCVSDGENLFAIMSRKVNKSEFGARFVQVMSDTANKHGMIPVIGTKGIYPSDQANFKHGIGVAALKRSKYVGLYMDRIHTKNDTVFEQRNIDCLTEAMVALAGSTAE